MEPSSIFGLPETLATIAASLAGALLVGQKLLKTWRESSTESSVLTLMHSELERMSKQNTFLAGELNKLQVDLVTLNHELRKLTIENQQLHAEVAALTGEVTRLQSILAKRGS